MCRELGRHRLDERQPEVQTVASGLLAVREDEVVGDRPRLSAEVGARLVFVELLPQSNPHFLGQVVGIGPTGHQGQDIAVEDPIVLAQQVQELFGAIVAMGVGSGWHVKRPPTGRAILAAIGSAANR